MMADLRTPDPSLTQLKQQELSVKMRTRIAGTNASFFIDGWDARFVRYRCKQNLPACVQPRSGRKK